MQTKELLEIKKGRTWLDQPASLQLGPACAVTFFRFKYKKKLASSCQLTCRYFYGHLLVEDFSKSRYGRVMLTDGTRKYLCRKAI